MYLKKNVLKISIKMFNEIWSTSDVQSSNSVLVKVVLFHLTGPGQLQDDARLNFSPESKSLILGLSEAVRFFSESFGKMT